MSKNLKAVSYLRCSTETQEDSPEQQEKEILKFAAAHGYEIVDRYLDFGKSGTTFTLRPEFLKLLRTVESPSRDFEAVICYDESRWGRAINSEENTYWRVHFAKFGVRVLLVKTAIDPEHEYAPMLQAFEGVIASQYSKNLSALTLRGAFSNGIYSNGGTAPYGYVRVAVNTKTGAERALAAGEWCVSGQEKVRWALGSADEVKTVQFIFEERARGRAYVLLAKELNDRGISCPKRGRWRNKDQKWSTVTVRSIIDNPTYYGARIYNRNSMSRIQARQKGRRIGTEISYPHWRNDRTEWITVENAHDAIVTKDLWDRANQWSQVSPQRQAVNRFTFSSPFLLTGLVRCSTCGFNYQGWSGRVKGKQYARYIDGGWKNKRVCSFHSVPKDLLEDATIQKVFSVYSEPHFIDIIEDQLQILYDLSPNQLRSEIGETRAKVVEIDAKIRKWIDVFEQDGSSAIIVNRLSELEQEKAVLINRLQMLETQTQKVQVTDVTRLVRNFLKDFEQRFREAKIEDQKRFCKIAVSDIIIRREDGEADLFIRKIPAVTEDLAQLYKNKKAVTKVMTAECSGDRT